MLISIIKIGILYWEHWLGDWEHLKPKMQQQHFFFLFCCCDDNSTHAIFKPSYVPKYMKIGSYQYSARWV